MVKVHPAYIKVMATKKVGQWPTLLCMPKHVR